MALTEGQAICRTALAKGLTEYGVSDHAPVVPEPFDDWRMLNSEMDDYLAWIGDARSHAAGRIPVRAGLECDWFPDCAAWIGNLEARFPWDYLIGSVHYLADRWDFDNPKWLGRWAEADVEEAWRLYWEEYTRMAGSGLFDLLAHPDLIKKFGFRPAGDLLRFYEPAVEAIAASGCVLEINTAGWHKPCGEQYPALAFLKTARDAGVPIVISSDAHAPDELGRDFPRAIALAREAGYEETVLFEGRRRRSEPLPSETTENQPPHDDRKQAEE